MCKKGQIDSAWNTCHNQNVLMKYSKPYFPEVFPRQYYYLKSNQPPKLGNYDYMRIILLQLKIFDEFVKLVLRITCYVKSKSGLFFYKWDDIYQYFLCVDKRNVLEGNQSGEILR